MLEAMIKMLFNFVQFDLYNGIVKKWKNLLAVLIAFVVINLLFTNAIYSLRESGIISSAAEMYVGDYIMYYLSGISEYIPDESLSFPLPFLWMLQSLGCCFFCLYYPLEDLSASGKHRLVLCGDRAFWWFSKCVWVGINVIVYYLIAYASSMIVGKVVGVEMSFTITEFTIHILRLTGEINPAPFEGTILFLVIPYVMISICMLQMLVSLFIKPLYSFVFSVAHLLAAAYFLEPFLIGNFAMLARSSLIDAKGIGTDEILVWATSVMLLVVVGGDFIFKNKDII